MSLQIEHQILDDYIQHKGSYYTLLLNGKWTEPLRLKDYTLGSFTTGKASMIKVVTQGDTIKTYKKEPDNLK
jgi:hypothetical protein